MKIWKLYAALFVILLLSLAWNILVHEPTHITVCLMQGGTPHLALSLKFAMARCDSGQFIPSREFLGAIAPYLLDAIVLLAFYFRKPKGAFLNLMQHVPFVDTAGQFLGSFFSSKSDFASIRSQIPAFYWLATLIVLFNCIVWAVLFKRQWPKIKLLLAS